MKKILLIFLILVSISSCSQFDEEIIQTVQNRNETTISPREQRAIAVALSQATALRKDFIIARSGSPIVFPAALFQPGICRGDQDSTILIVEFPDNQGFAVVNPDLSSDPVIALIDEGRTKKQLKLISQCSILS